VRAHAGLGSWERVHAWLACATREDLTAGPGAGLWFGTAAVAFAVSTVAAPGQYPQARTVLDAAVAKMVRARLDEASARMAAAVRPSLSEFDVVHGLAGLGAYLLRHHGSGELVRQVLAYLVELTKPVPAADQAAMSVPGWWTSDAPSGQLPGAFRGGHADLGMAHGISGPLALLALAMRQGIIVDGQVAAIDRICRWLDTWRHDGPSGPWWPQRVSLTELRTGLSTDLCPGRPSWCYGTPGLARAQQLAGHATGDHARRRLAEHALARCLSDPTQLARITDPALCHGWAGLITTAWYAAADAGSPEIAAHLPRLLDALLEHSDPCSARPYGQPYGLIDGSAGIAATLHTMATGISGGWESCLLVN